MSVAASVLPGWVDVKTKTHTLIVALDNLTFSSDIRLSLGHMYGCMYSYRLKSSSAVGYCIISVSPPLYLDLESPFPF